MSEENKASIHFQNGKVMYKQENYAEAIKEFDEAIRLNPNEPDYHHIKGTALCALSMYDEAIVEYDEAIRLEPKKSDYHSSKAKPLYNLKRYDESIVELDKAIKMDPQQRFHYFRKANLLKELGRYDEALAVYDEPIRLDPRRGSNYFGKANLLKELGRYDEALAVYDELIKKNPSNSFYHSLKANLLEELGRYDEALAVYDEAISKYPTKSIYHSSKANLLKELKRYDEAIAEYDEAIRKNPNYSGQHSEKADLLKELERYDEAIAEYDKEIEIYPTYAWAYLGKGKTLLDLGKPEEALKENELAVKYSKELGIKELNRGITELSAKISKAIENKKKGKALSLPHLASEPPVTKLSPTIGYLDHERFLSERYGKFYLIGQGGFAKVYSVKGKDGQILAVKIPTTFNEETGKSFLREVRSWEDIKNHPNIVRLYGTNIYPIPYLEMEYLPITMESFAREPHDFKESITFVLRLLDGLSFAHGKGIAHLDLKPSNILIDKNGNPKITDWGLSRKDTSASTHTKVSSFTESYASPEQFNGRGDRRSDVWQIGVIMCFLLTHKLPFDTIFNIVSAPPNIEINDREISAVIKKCLEKDPKDRYQNASELSNAIMNALDEKKEIKRQIVALGYTINMRLLLREYLKNEDFGSILRYFEMFNLIEKRIKPEYREQVKQVLENLKIAIEFDLPVSEDLRKSLEMIIELL